MRPTTRTALIALAIGASLLVQPRAQADVRLFEDTPSLEQLRAILIPESHGGMTRRIEIPRPVEASRPIQPAAAGPMPQAQQDTTAVSGTSASAAAPALVVSPPAKPVEATAAPADDTANAVGFRINFAFNSAVIPPEHFAQLDRVAELLHQEPGLSLAVEGHTDAVGSADYNIDLSRRRAEAVVHYLTDHGVDASRLMAVGKGKTEPLVANPMDGRNRRVQFVRLRPETTS
jgi:outer membrane protein OmpA-like peptidoglycan-associated protein